MAVKMLAVISIPLNGIPTPRVSSLIRSEQTLCRSIRAFKTRPEHHSAQRWNPSVKRIVLVWNADFTFYADPSGILFLLDA
jgi:hypothetical protein